MVNDPVLIDKVIRELEKIDKKSLLEAKNEVDKEYKVLEENLEDKNYMENVAGNYVRRILIERNMTQTDLLRRMKELKLAKEKTLVIQKLNNWINNIDDSKYVWARRIEIALELPDYILVKMKGNPTEKEWKKIKEIGKNVL